MNARRALLLTVVCAAALAGEAQALAGRGGAVVGWGRSSCRRSSAEPVSRRSPRDSAAPGPRERRHSRRVGGGSDDGDCAVPPGLSEVAGIAVGLSHMLALKSDGTVVGGGTTATARA